jgi:hypothetical protein
MTLGIPPQSAAPPRSRRNFWVWPLSFATFASLDPVYVTRVEVSDDELAGYRIWRNDGGGFF